MFAIILSYKKPLDTVDAFVEEHKRFLEAHYASGHFLLSGRKQPRTGGLILAQASSKHEMEAIIRLDPFWREEIADYDIIEFVPGMASDLFGSLLTN